MRRFRYRDLPHSFLFAKHYTNTGDRTDGWGTPMVVLAWHLRSQSPLGDVIRPRLGLTPSTRASYTARMASSKALKPTPDTLNMARALVKAGSFANMAIDKALNLPAYTAAGLAAAAKRYGRHVLDQSVAAR